MPREFNKEAYAEVNKKSIDAVVRYLEFSYPGIWVFTTENYHADIRAVHENGRVQYMECEHRSIWLLGEFPYPTIHVPLRKRKLWERHGKADLSFWILSSDYSRALKFEASDVSKCLIKDVWLGRHGHKEYFYDVPISKGEEICLSLE